MNLAESQDTETVYGPQPNESWSSEFLHCMEDEDEFRNNDPLFRSYRIMKQRILTSLSILVGLLFAVTVQAADPAPKPGTEEFGLTPRELVQAIDQVEALIAKCMRGQGFEYVAADYNRVRKGMSADKTLPGMSEEDFIDRYGLGISTFYTGQPPQLAAGYSPAQVGLGERNVDIFKNLSPADQVAYNRALFGENPGESFAVALEGENFSRTGGCTREAIGQVFTEDQMQASYYNPKDALINQDPRMKKALRKYAAEMRTLGLDYNHPDEVEPDIRERLAALTNNGTLRVEDMTPEQRDAFKQLQAREHRVAAIDLRLAEEFFEPVEAAIEKELFAREVK